MGSVAVSHPLDALSADEVTAAATAVRAAFEPAVRFCSISLLEPTLSELRSGSTALPRKALVVLIIPSQAKSYEAVVVDGQVLDTKELPEGTQPPFSPDDCFLAEKIVKDGIADVMRDRYGVEDLSLLACDPWSVHISDASYAPLKRSDGLGSRLVQTFLYLRDDADDNHYAHPLDILPVVDLNSETIVAIEGLEREPPKIPDLSVNYHRSKLSSNSYLGKEPRKEKLAPLHITQPDGPSFDVNGSHVSWQKWAFRVSFNAREGLVLHDVSYSGRSVVARASFVEMAVPYADPHPGFSRKCAFDVGDYGLGYCTDSLELGCDCAGEIYYFDGVLSDSKGDPYTVKKAICMHEIDDGLLWKHVEYRTGHNESRRSRKLVLSFLATVVNYEYLFYIYFSQDGSIDFEIKLSGELSTNLLSEGEESPEWGVYVAPGVNAQFHQHMFCARLVMAVDGEINDVSEVDIVAVPPGPENPYGNSFRAVETQLVKESTSQRDAAPGRTWKISSTTSRNEVNGAATSYKLVPNTRGSPQPPLLCAPSSAVSKRGVFATKSLWVTPYDPGQNFPAGQYPTQDVKGGKGLPEWTSADRSLEGEQVCLWHSFGVAHIPRVEDFPVMPVEMCGFSLKPYGFFSGNPATDLAPDEENASRCCSGGD